MLNNIQEFYSILPLVILGAVILISVVIEIYSESSEKILPWFSILAFGSVAVYSLLNLEQNVEVFLP
ncbi:MAG: hypothetical protein P8Y81_13705 [Ignavibacteriaceae bacterium]